MLCSTSRHQQQLCLLSWSVVHAGLQPAVCRQDLLMPSQQPHGRASAIGFLLASCLRPPTAVEQAALMPSLPPTCQVSGATSRARQGRYQPRHCLPGKFKHRVVKPMLALRKEAGGGSRVPEGGGGCQQWLHTWGPEGSVVSHGRLWASLIVGIHNQCDDLQRCQFELQQRLSSPCIESGMRVAPNDPGGIHMS